LKFGVWESLAIAGLFRLFAGYRVTEITSFPGSAFDRLQEDFIRKLLILIVFCDR
jgi:hypothetical protein